VTRVEINWQHDLHEVRRWLDSNCKQGWRFDTKFVGPEDMLVQEKWVLFDDERDASLFLLRWT